MKRWERWSFNLLSLVVAASGFAYLWMKYILETTDPFALVNHPWQSIMLLAHVIASPPLILVVGIILSSHILKKMRVRGAPSRKSGLVSLSSFATLAASGYLLQVVTSEAWLTGLVVAHVASAVLFTVFYAGHLVLSAAAVRRRPSVAPARVA